MEDRKVKKGKDKDKNSFSNKLGKLTDRYQRALNRQAASFEMVYHTHPHPEEKK